MEILLTAGLFFGGGVLVLIAAGSGKKGAAFHRAMGAAMTVCGAGCACMVLFAANDPESMTGPRGGGWMDAALIGLIGTVFFGGGGLYLLAKGLQPPRSKKHR